MPKRPITLPTRERHYIREWREARSLTQAQLAEAVGSSTANISRIENNRQAYTQDMLEAIARCLGVSTATLLSGPPDAHANPTNAGFAGVTAAPEFRRISIVGFISNADIVDYISDDPEKGLGFLLETKHVFEAVVVRGSNLAPTYRDGDILVYQKLRPLSASFLGAPCIVELTDGRFFLKQLLPGSSPDLFTLTSHNLGIPAIVDVAVRHAAPIVLHLSSRFRESHALQR